MPERKQVIVVDNTRSPFEVLLLLALVLSGISGLIPHDRVFSVDLLLGDVAWLWYFGILVGGALGFVSTLLKFPFGLLIERVAMILVAGLMLAYGVGLYILIGFAAPRGGALLVLAIGAAAGVRVWQIRHELARLQKGVL